MDASRIMVLCAAGFGGAALNALAGGGSFLTLPALLWAGVPAVAANATGTAALLPGYVASAWGQRGDLGAPRALGMRTLLIACLLGGLVGAALLLRTGNTAFRAIVPWLLLFATALFAFGPVLLRALGRHPHQTAGRAQAVAAMLLVSAYGGYFNGGLGVLLLALLGLLGEIDLNRMNALKNLISAVLTVFAVGLYAAGGTVRWDLAAVMLPAVLLGGWTGAHVGRRLPRGVLRWGIVGIGLAMSALFMR